MTQLLAVLLAGSAAMLAYLCVISRKRLDDVKLFEAHGDAFYASARPLFDDADTPIEMLAVLNSLGWCITNAVGPLVVYKVFAEPKKILELPPGYAEHRKAVREFLAVRPELEKPYFEALWHAPLAVSYRTGRYGSLIREGLVGIETRERKQDVSLAIRYMPSVPDFEHVKPAKQGLVTV